MGCGSSDLNSEILPLHNFTLDGTFHTGKIARVIDGDTYEIQFVIESDDITHPITRGRSKIAKPVGYTTQTFKFTIQMKCRLYGVDTSEKNTEKGQEAKIWVETWFAAHPSFEFTTNGWDKYGRLLVSIGDLSQELLNHGLAKPYFGGTKT